MRLIDADALMDKITIETIFIKDGLWVSKIIADAPTVEAIPIRRMADDEDEWHMVLALCDIAKKYDPEITDIVRCKDCEYWQDNNGGYPHEECRWGKEETPDADDFCSWGERKGGTE